MARKQWPLEIYGMETILEDGIDVKDLGVKDILLLMLIELKKVETHLSIVSSETIDEKDLGG